MKKILLSGLLVGLVMLVISVALNFLWPVIFPSVTVEYQTPLFRPWSDPLMSLIFVCPVLTGFFMAWVWNMFKNYHMFPISKKVLTFSGSFVVMSIIGMIMTYSCFPISFLMLMTWCVSMVVQYFVGTWVLAKMNK